MITLKGNTANLEGLSTDQKPNDVPVNTEFRELDTNCRFYFTGESWEEIPSSGGGGGSGTSNYNELENKPQIAGVTLSGNKTLANLGIQGELSFDNAPTEDSTNPVTSGGVYEALQAKQDTLTIDDTPTEDSENPVTSGGVYSALEDKQDNLVFDGTYDSSTNKAATESTVSDAVSTAIGNLTNSDVGLGNVTNNTQIKALSGSVTSGGIVTFGADGATVSDSGKTIETNLSNSNDNVPTSKAVRDKVAGSATMASNYTTDSSEANITSASTINDAIEQLDYRTATNKTNILSIPRCDMDRLPITFTANSAGNLKGYTIYGNSDKVGEQTVNLFDKSSADVAILYPSDTGVATVPSGYSRSIIIAVEPSTTYTIQKLALAAGDRARVAGYSAYPVEGATCEFVDNEYEQDAGLDIQTFTTTANTAYILFFVMSTSQTLPERLQEIINSIQLQTGSTATDYEPYGYKIPITCGGVTTNVYSDSQLDKGDMLTLGESETNIPVALGSNTITTTLSNKPIMWIKYE